ncbi:MAG TPA: polysaccharide biosynthesis protein, partial [Gammaproteobacteria bacterium]|nr:polysaccharide biosynthesis protein [Gammaproteobacteria bacterium]
MASSGFSWKSPWTALAHDMLSIPIAWFFAYWVRFNLSTIPSEILHHAVEMLPWVMGAQACSFWFFGLYRGVWRYASLPDLVRIFKAVSIGCLFSLFLLFFLFRLNHMPRTVFPMYGTLLLLLLGGSRFFYRWLKDFRSSLGIAYQRVLIVGAGTAGESLCRDLLRDQTAYLPVAFVDNNPEDLGREIHGVQVKGNYVKIPDIVQTMAIDLILLAIPNANAKEIRYIHTLCQSTGKPVHTLPSIDDLFEGRVSVKNLRKISLSDLLGRDPVNLDKKAIQQSLTHKVVLISGGAGSIGSELCRQVAKFQPQELVIIDNNEYHLFLLEQEFKTLN